MRYPAPALLLACVILPHLEAAEFFVDAQAAGRTTQDGSAAHPWSDLTHAVAKLAPQDVLSLRPGLYRQRQLTIAANDVWVRKDPAVPGVVVIDGAVPLNELMNQDEHGRQKTRDNGPYFDPLITVTGNGVVLDGLEVRHGFVGISVRGERAKILDCHVHHTGQHGIEVMNHHGLVEDCVVHDANLYNVNGQCLVGGVNPVTGQPDQNSRKKITSSDPARHGQNMDWGQGITFHGKYRQAWAPRGCVLRGNLLWNIWGEGLATYNASEVRMERNVVFNVWRMAYYVQNVDSATLDANLAFYDLAFRVRLGDYAMAVCYSFANEYPADLLRVAKGPDQPLLPDGSDLTLINNLSYGGNYALHSGDRHKLSTRGRIRVGNNLLIRPARAACINLDTSIAGPVELRNNLLVRATEETDASSFLNLAQGLAAECTDNIYHRLAPAAPCSIAMLEREVAQAIARAEKISGGQSWDEHRAPLLTHLRALVGHLEDFSSAVPAASTTANFWAGPDFFGFPPSQQNRVGPFARPPATP